MADKYISHGNTFNGDGTSSADATSDGGVGAWNNFIEIFVGTITYGTLLAGDKIYVRTHNGTSDITVLATSSITSNNISSPADPIYWFFDDGNIWANGGTFTLNVNSGQNVTFGYGHVMKAVAKNFVVESLYLNSHIFVNFRSCEFHDVYFLTPDNAVAHQSYRVSFYSYHIATFHKCKFKFGSMYPSLSYSPFNFPVYRATVIATNLEVIIPTEVQDNCAIFGNLTSQLLKIDGLKITGGWETLHLYAESTVSSNSALVFVNIHGLQTNGLIQLNGRSNTDSNNASYVEISISNIDAEFFDCVNNTRYGSTQWRKGQNYPVLNATLPDDFNTPWALKVYPALCSGTFNMRCSDIVKFYNADSGNNTFSFNILIQEAYGTPQKDGWWVELTYTDVNGDIVRINTKTTGDLATSTAEWSTLVYGSKNYDAYEIVITTTAQVLKNSIIKAAVVSSVQAPTNDAFYFVDPEFSIEGV